MFNYLPNIIGHINHIQSTTDQVDPGSGLFQWGTHPNQIGHLNLVGGGRMYDVNLYASRYNGLYRDGWGVQPYSMRSLFICRT